jgi:hypothetical protein
MATAVRAPPMIAAHETAEPELSSTITVAADKASDADEQVLEP